MKTNGFELERGFYARTTVGQGATPGFLFVKADRIQNWSEQECRTVFNRMFANYGEVNL